MSAIVIDYDENPENLARPIPVVLNLDGEPPVAQSKRWGDLRWRHTTRTGMRRT